MLQTCPGIQLTAPPDPETRVEFPSLKILLNEARGANLLSHQKEMP